MTLSQIGYCFEQALTAISQRTMHAHSFNTHVHIAWIAIGTNIPTLRLLNYTPMVELQQTLRVCGNPFP